MEGQPNGVCAGGGDAVPHAGGDGEVISSLKLEGAIVELKGGGAFDEGDPLWLVLVIPMSGRAGMAEGGDVFCAKAAAREQRGDDFLIRGRGRCQEGVDFWQHVRETISRGCGASNGEMRGCWGDWDRGIYSAPKNPVFAKPSGMNSAVPVGPAEEDTRSSVESYGAPGGRCPTVFFGPLREDGILWGGLKSALLGGNECGPHFLWAASWGVRCFGADGGPCCVA
jgi:hypothetical protein